LDCSPGVVADTVAERLEPVFIAARATDTVFITARATDSTKPIALATFDY